MTWKIFCLELALLPIVCGCAWAALQFGIDQRVVFPMSFVFGCLTGLVAELILGNE